MLPYILALAVAVGSFAIYMAAFFFPEVHRKGDLVWSGVGLFYALVLWFCAGRISGAVLLGQMASVGLLGWFGWQALTLRRQTTPLAEQTPVSEEQIDRLTGGLTGLFKPKAAPKPQTVPQPVAETALKVEAPAVAPSPAPTVPEVPPAPGTPEPATPAKPAAQVTPVQPKPSRFADRFSFLFKTKDKDKGKDKTKTKTKTKDKSKAQSTPEAKTQPQPPAEVVSVPQDEPTLVQPPVPVEPPPPEPGLIQPPVPVEPPLPEPGLIQPEPEVIPGDAPGEVPTGDPTDQPLEMPAAAAMEGATVESEVSEEDDFGFDDDDLETPKVTKAEAQAIAEPLPNPPLDQPVKPSLNKVAAKSATPGAKKSPGLGLLTQIQAGLRGLLKSRKSPPVKPSAPSSQPVAPKTEGEPQPAIAVESISVESSPEVADPKPPEETPTVVVTTPDVVVEVTVQEGEAVEVVTSANPSAEEPVEAVLTTGEGIVEPQTPVLEAIPPHPPETEPPAEVVGDLKAEVVPEGELTPELVAAEVVPEGELTPEPVEDYAPEVELAPPAEAVIPTVEGVVEPIEASEAAVEGTPASPEESESPEIEGDRLLQRLQRPDPAVVEATRESEEADESPVTPASETEPPSQKEGNS